MFYKTLLTPQMRDLLIEHVNGPLPTDHKIVKGSMTEKTDLAVRWRSIREAVQKSLLNVVNGETVLTEKGRELLGATLGDYADALVRARWPGINLDLFPHVSPEVAKSEKFHEAIELAFGERPLDSGE